MGGIGAHVTTAINAGNEEIEQGRTSPALFVFRHV
jgi:hypothetical protein